MSDPRDELAGADVISSGGGECFGAFGAPRVVRLVRSRRARVIGVPVLAGAVAAAALLVTASQPTHRPGPPGRQTVIANTAVQPAGVVGPGGWIGATGCRRGRDCPRG